MDPECLFSFSGATVSKIRNQLSNASAKATVMVGQWAAQPDLNLLATEEFEEKLVQGWKRGAKKRARADTVVPELSEQKASKAAHVLVTKKSNENYVSDT